MTREELKAHCEKQIKGCEKWAKHKGEKPSGKVYEEHKLILELLEQEPCNDCISREKALELAENSHRLAETMEDLAWLYENNLKALPSVQPKQGPILDKIKAEIEKQYKWLLSAEVTTYNIDIAFDAIRKAAEGEKE